MSSTTLLRPFRSLRPLSLLRAAPTPTPTASLRHYSSKDPAHTHLYYHPTPAANPTSIRVSYLPTEPTEASRTFIGSLPARPGAGLSSFAPNPPFLKLLHEAILQAIEAGKAGTVEYEAATRPGDGFMHIVDERNLPPPGRVGDADDIIASIFVQDGKVVPSTYEPSPTYRLVTGEGVCTLPRGIDEYVVGVLERVDREEKGE